MTILKWVSYLFCDSGSCRLSYNTADLVLCLAILSFPKCIERRMVKWYTTKNILKKECCYGCKYLYHIFHLSKVL